MARPTLFDHRKFRRLARSIGSEALALGSLEFLWMSAYASGDPSLGDSADVEAAAHWQGNAGDLCAALLDAGGEGHPGFIEPNGEAGRFQVHDLWDHAPEYVQRRAAREAERISKGLTLSDMRRKAALAMHAKRANDKLLHASDVQKSPLPHPHPLPHEKEKNSAPSGVATRPPKERSGFVDRCFRMWQEKFDLKPSWAEKDFIKLASARKKCGSEKEAELAFESFLLDKDAYYVGSHEPGKFLQHLDRFRQANVIPGVEWGSR